MRFVAIVSALVVSANLGCSFVFSEGPPIDHTHMPYFDCTSTYGLPVADGFFATTGLLGAAGTLSKSNDEYAAQNNGGKRNVAAGADIALAAIYGASAVYGIVQASRCARAKAELKARILGPFPGARPTLPPRWPPPNAQPTPATPTIPAPVPAPPTSIPPAPEQQPAPPPSVPAPPVTPPPG